KMSIPRISAAKSDVLMALLLQNKQRGIVPKRGSMTTQHFRNLLRRMKRGLSAFSMDQIDLVKIIFFWKKQYFTIKSMLKIKMFAWDLANLCVVDGLIVEAHDCLVESV
ncbi:unnamed protein product, partial [Ilex paraguariensis]